MIVSRLVVLVSALLAIVFWSLTQHFQPPSSKAQANSDTPNNAQSNVNQELVDLYNQARSENSQLEQYFGCDRSNQLNLSPPLRWNKALARAAQRQADWMSEQKQLSHGASLQRRARSVGYSYRAIAENIASTQAQPERLIRLWLKSEPHCTNILNPEYRDIGVGNSGGYWAVVLGREF